MTTARRTRWAPAPAVPAECWYAVAPAGAVGRELTAIRAVDTSVVLYRTTAGEVVALRDCCAHRPYPLSAGRLDGDVLRCGLCGFEYGPDGRCVRVPTQDRVPLAAAVPAYPVRERHGLVWLWLGAPGHAALHRIPSLSWLDADGWATVAGERTVAAGFLLLHESFADVTKIPVLAPDVSPAVLSAAPPRLEVVVTETTVSLRRRFPAAPLPDWQATAIGVPAGTPMEHRQEGHFLSPAAWVDHWDVGAEVDRPALMRFTQLVTPVDAGSSRLLWRVSRTFAPADAELSARLAGMFTSYYARLATALETTQALLDRDGPRPEVNVSADVAALKVRGIVAALLAEEGAVGAGTGKARRRATAAAGGTPR